MSCSQIDHPEVACGPLKIRRMSFTDVGHVVTAHTHDFDHVTFCTVGAVRVNLDGVETDLVPGAFVNVPADAEHEITGLVANSEALCVFVNHGNERDTL